MRKSILFITVLILVMPSCNEDNADKVTAAVQKAAMKCGVSPSEMNWLRDMIIASETNMSKQGSFYAIESSVGTIILHQPLVLSCVVCVKYSCDGSVPTLSEQVIRDELSHGMTEANKIYGL